MYNFMFVFPTSQRSLIMKQYLQDVNNSTAILDNAVLVGILLIQFNIFGADFRV